MILNLLTNPVACCNKANRCQLCSSHQKKGSIKCETGKWEAVVTNDSIGACSSDLYTDYFFETSGTASCGTTGSDYRFEEVISVCYRTLPILALGRALHCEPVALTGGHIAGQTTSLPEGWVKTTAFGGYFLGCSKGFCTLSRSTFRLHHLDMLMPDGQTAFSTVSLNCHRTYRSSLE